jgi:hypothetical protein
MRCAGSVKLSQGMPNPGTRNAAEGTFAHEIAASALNNIQPPERWLGKKRVIDNFEIECTPEMIAAVKSYVDDIDEELMPMDKHWTEVDLTPALQKLHPAFGGTADFVRYRPSTKHLRVRDLKYGAGVIVEVEDNEQARVYALGALLTLGAPCDKVTVTIDQPRAEHPDGRSRDHTFDAVELLDFAADMVEKAKATEAPAPALVPGEKQCRWCLAKAKCPALEKQQHDLMVHDFADPVALPPEKLAQALAIFPAVKARIKAIEEAAYAAAERGETIPGYKLVEKRPTRKWAEPDAVVAWAKEKGLDPYAAPEILSPAQMEKRVAEGAPRGAKKDAAKPLAQWIKSESSGHALVAVEDDRKEVKRIEDKDFAAPVAAANEAKTATINLF